MTRKLGWLLPLFTAGCASLNLQAATARSEARWFAATGLHVAPSSVEWHAGDLSAVCHGVAHHLGCTDRITRKVWVSVDITDNDELDLVVTHEFGHLLAPYHGHLHGGYGDGVMCEGIEEAMEKQPITDHDINLVCWKGRVCPYQRPEAHMKIWPDSGDKRVGGDTTHSAWASQRGQKS